MDKQGKVIGFLLSATRDASTARRFFHKAMGHRWVHDMVTRDKSDANKAALDQLNMEQEIPTGIRQARYLNNIEEQDHRAVKRAIRSMLGFKSFLFAQAGLTGMELMHMTGKGQFMMKGCDGVSFAD